MSQLSFGLNLNATFHWAFVDDENVLVYLNKTHQQILNELWINHSANYTFSYHKYSTRKEAKQEALQENINTHKTRKIFKLSYQNGPSIKFDSKMGDKMVEELFYRSVVRNKYEITKIQAVDTEYANLSDIYHTWYKKYERGYSGSNLEMLLFHGTDSKLLKQIEKNGFDRNFNKTAAYGKVKQQIEIYSVCKMNKSKKCEKHKILVPIFLLPILKPTDVKKKHKTINIGCVFCQESELQFGLLHIQFKYQQWFILYVIMSCINWYKSKRKSKL